MNTHVPTNSNNQVHVKNIINTKTNIHTNANINANTNITISYMNTPTDTGTVLLLAIPNTNIHNFLHLVLRLIRQDVSTSVQLC